MDYAVMTQFAMDVARRAGDTIMIALPQLREDDIEFKSSRQDLVTRIDRSVEQQIVADLKSITPDAAFLGEEEGGEEDSSAIISWVIDPIDGTRYFARGLPMFSITIAMLHQGKACIGVIHQPATGQMHSAHVGGGAFRNGHRLGGSQITKLSEAIVYLDMRHLERLSRSERKWFDSKILDLMHNCYRIRTCGAAAIGATWAAAGAVDAFIDLTGYDPLWDMLAAQVIMSETGAESERISVQTGPPRLVSANPILRNALVKLLMK